MAIRDASKWKIDIMLPLLFAMAVTLAIWQLPVKPPTFGNAGILAALIGLLQILPGFYLTALAAVATFNRPDMDQLMPKPVPTVRISISGINQEVELTRRRMLAMLFGYLTFICFGLYLLTLASQIAAPSVESIVPKHLHIWVVAVFSMLFNFMFGQLVFITMFGLYQLSDRMHQPD